jgi:large subunit ribosomal protein L29
VSKLSERRREIQAMSEAQSQQELADLRRKLFDLRLQKARGEVRDNRQFPKIRADVARLMHHLGELRHAEEMAVSGELADHTAGEE